MWLAERFGSPQAQVIRIALNRLYEFECKLDEAEQAAVKEVARHNALLKWNLR